MAFRLLASSRSKRKKDEDVQFVQESVNRFSLADKAGLKVAVMAKESKASKEKPHAPHSDNTRGAREARPYPLKGPSTEYAN